MRKKTPVSLEEEKRIARDLYEQAKNSAQLDHARISGSMSRVNFVDWKIINSGRRDLLGE